MADLNCRATGPKELVDKVKKRAEEIGQRKSYSSSTTVPTREMKDVALANGEEDVTSLVEEDVLPTVGEEFEDVVPTKGEEIVEPTKREEDHVPTNQGEVWLSFKDIVLHMNDKQIINCCQCLMDQHINFAQRLLKHQFPRKNGLRLTFIQE